MQTEIRGTQDELVGSLFPIQSSQNSFNISDIMSIFEKIKSEMKPKPKNRKGKYLVAKQSFRKGDKVFSEKLFSFKVTSGLVSSICNYSLKSGELESISQKGEAGHVKLLKETSSKNAWFLSKTELKSAWENGHKEHVNGYLHLKRQGIHSFFVICYSLSHFRQPEIG